MSKGKEKERERERERETKTQTLNYRGQMVIRREVDGGGGNR